jgi:hypothetical protein
MSDETFFSGVDRSAAKRGADGEKYVRAYAVIRIAVGFIGILIPIVLFIGEAAILDASVHARDSLSSYYHSSMRDFFVASLCVVGVLLITYMWGEWNADFVASTVAGVFLIGVAFFPTERPDIPTNAPHCGDLPQPQGCTALEQRFGEVTIGNVHLTCAAIALVSLGVIAYLFGRREEVRSRQILHYALCGVIFTSLVVALTGWISAWRLLGLTPLYIGEVVTVFAFGAGWLVKGFDLRRMLGATTPS